MSPRRSLDGARIEILAVLIVILVMMSTISWWVSLARSHSSTSEPSADALDIILHDEIATMRDTPLPPARQECGGKNLGEELLNRAVAGDVDELGRRLDAKLGDGVRKNVLLKSGDLYYSLIHEFDNPGNAGEKYLWLANHSYTKLILANDAESGQDNMIVDVPTANRVSLLKAKGEGIRTMLTIDGAVVDHVLEATGLTAMPPDGHIDYHTRQYAQNIAWVANELSDEPVISRNLEVVELGTVMSHFVRLEPGPTGPTFSDEYLPQNLKLVITVPSGWDLDEANTRAVNSAWNLAVTGSEERGWNLEFRLAETLSTATTVELRVTAPASPVRPFDDFYAKLGNGSLGESTLLVSYPSSVQRDLPRVVYATTPYPVHEGTWALFGVAFGNGGEDAVTVKQVVVEIPGGVDVDGYQTKNWGLGAELFAAEDPVSRDDNGGTWTRVDSRHLRWTPDAGSDGIEVAAGRTEFWAFDVKFTADKTQATSIQPAYDDGPVSTLTFPNGYTHTSRRWGPTPGVIRHVVPPASNLGAGTDGYPWDALGTERTIQAHVTGYLFEEFTNATYVTRAQSGDAVAMQSAVANSSFRSTQRLVPAGDTVNVVADIASLSALASTMGATSTMFKADLFSPNMLGCAPVSSFTREIESLPHGAVRDIELWDPTGTTTPTAFLTGDDMVVYKLDAAGLVLWRRELDSGGLVLEPASFGLLDKALFVGQANGRLKRLDPADGSLDWQVMIPRAAWSTSKVPNSVTSIAVDEANQRVLVSTSQGAVELRSAAGTLLGRYESTTPGDATTQVAIAPNGRMFGVGNFFAEFVYDPDIGLTIVRTGYGGTHLAPGSVGIILHDGTNTRIVDYDTLSGDIRYTHGLIQLATSGDATGDGIDDHVLALQDLDVVVIDGATGNIAWTYDAGTPPSGGANPVENFLVEGQDAACASAQENLVGLYPDEVDCSVVAASNVVLALDARSGRVAVARRYGEANQLLLLAGANGMGSPAWTPATQTLSADSLPTVVKLGTWTASGGVGTGTDDGTLTVHDRTSGAPLLSTQPTEFAGKFSFLFPIPQGGLYGMHLVAGTLTWEDATGTEYSAEMIDTFEVVTANGIPPVRPFYVALFQTEDSGDPMIPGRG